MHGFFKANGGCGYVKKPDFLLKAGPTGDVFDPKASLPVVKTLKVQTLLCMYIFPFKLQLLTKVLPSSKG